MKTEKINLILNFDKFTVHFGFQVLHNRRMMKFRLHFPGFFTSIFRVFAIEENQKALSTSGQESNSPQKDNNDEKRPAGFNILPTDPAFRQPDGIYERYAMIGAAGLSELELDHESLTIVPNKLRTNQNSQSNETSCSEQWELIPDCGHSDSESTSGEEWELIPDDGRSNSESTSGEYWGLIPGYGRSDSESTSGEHWELIPGYDHSGSESSSSESSWEILSDHHSDSDDCVCVESNCGDPWQMLQEPLQGPGTQPKQGAVSRFLLLVNENLILSTLLRVWYLCSYLFLLSKRILSLVTGKGINRGSHACHVPSMEGLEAGRFCTSQRNVITNVCTADPGSCVRGGAVARSLHLNIGQNTNSGGDQKVGGVNYKEGYVRLAVNGARDILINGQLYLNRLSQAP